MSWPGVRSRTRGGPPSSSRRPTRPHWRPIQNAVVIGYQRTLKQDVRFGMRQLVDIALGALFPAVNDPYTAIQAIHRLTVLLCALGPLPLGDYQISGSTDASRVIVHAPHSPTTPNLPAA